MEIEVMDSWKIHALNTQFLTKKEFSDVLTKYRGGFKAITEVFSISILMVKILANKSVRGIV